MTDTSRKTSNFPKKHLLALGGVAAMLSLALLFTPESDPVVATAPAVAGQESRQEAASTAQVDDAVEQAVTEKIAAESNIATPAASEVAATTASSADDSSKTSSETAQTAAAEAEQAARPNEQRVTVEPGDTLASIFARVSLSPTVLHRVLESHPDARALGNLRPGQIFDFILDKDGNLQTLSSSLSALETLQVSRNGERFEFKRDLIKPEIREAHTRGTISSSLFNAATAAGLSYAMTLDLANVFGYDIDFALDLREGDSFDVLYEEKLVDGKRVGTGNILAARFINQGKAHTAVRYTDKAGNSSYYTAEGNSMRKAFIRTPVDIARITSRFSTARLHPVLNTIRAHKGVDYAAPVGTAIKATGDGKVFLAGRQGGYGNVIIIQHGNSYRTLYGHMSGFANGVRTGSPVRQGQIIGYVGTTGLSSGPHLHYEFQVNGKHVDPLSQKLPMAEPIAKVDLAKFLDQSRQLMARIDQPASTTRLASSGN